ncbi:biotin/lipoyl-binding protein [Tenacibaculum tangerinum]|uniref:Biotin/lipoyl-binding protein n=1 Tax=Tenacibaculum tangerinum TaxID=3038772 RepID=A0ABY8KZ51_9FLAO|nr:biotin/lipoyl-binding protein [Tenacibaculum tangerinum]WGH74116.1 biotin/lipoyl-binding protein [Tenacibaculum tangerinum]
MLRVILLFFVVLLVSCQNEKKPSEEESQTTVSTEGVYVTVLPINTDTFNQQLIVNGKIHAIQKAELRFKTSNQLATVNVRNGEKVKHGRVIASLENELLKNEVQKAEIDVQKSENKLSEEKINYDSEKLPEKVLANLKVKSGVVESKNNLEKARIQYSQTFLKAPFTGVVANVEKK